MAVPAPDRVVPLKRPSAAEHGSEPPSPEPFLSTPGADHPSETSVRVDGQGLTGQVVSVGELEVARH